MYKFERFIQSYTNKYIQNGVYSCDNAKCVYTENRTSQISKQGEIYAECEYNALILF